MVKSMGQAVLNGSPEMTVDQMEKEMILQALNRTAGNRTLAAEQLGMSRRTLHRKLNKFDVTRRVVDEPDARDGEASDER
jgi:DNA-binding NtrC family response regulator